MKHLRDINEGYFEHMASAMKYGCKMISAGIACIIHALIPNAFITTGSDTMKKILEDIDQRKQKGVSG